MAAERAGSWAYGCRGAVLKTLGRHAEALADFDRAVELEPGSASVRCGRGEAFRLLGRYEEALADLDRAVGLDPEDSWCAYEKAVVLRALGLPGGAELLARVVELVGPGDVHSLGDLVLAYAAVPAGAEAAAALERFLAAGPPTGRVDELYLGLETLARALPVPVAALRERLREAVPALVGGAPTDGGG